ncbi:hypothetical protein [Psychroserpens burtonensis]|uniref:hypothetical protein n=1 Tax=Psychroserpens burtonensis TaxID=49278 RepID=UPI0004236E9A|nr:hypothetical protein [Psychroserpens burtonensis]
MAKKENITDFEDEISVARNEFRLQTKNILSYLKSDDIIKSEVQERLNDLHTSAVDYFGMFSRSINEYSTTSFDSNSNIIKSKVDDAISISTTINKHWQSLELYKLKYDVIIPKPSKKAYSSIQAFISKYDKDEAKSSKEEFKKNGLPTDGFNKKRRYVTITDNTVLFGHEIPWEGIAVLSGLISVIVYKIIQSNPEYIDEVIIGFGVTIFVLILNPKRRFYRGFWSTMSLLSTLIILPAFDFTAQIELNELGSFEQHLYRIVVEEPHWIIYLVLGAIAITCLILDAREQRIRK